MSIETDDPTNDEPCWIETALDWLQRSQNAMKIVPTDAVTAAQAFVNGDASTGIAFMDEALKTNQQKSKPAILELSGKAGTSWTLISLAARFVVATRPSKFRQSPQPTDLPKIVMIDSLHSICIQDLVSAVRGTLLLDGEIDAIDSDLEQCLTRIHLIFVSDTTPTVAALEALRCKFLTTNEDVPNLLLWDSFLTTIPDKNGKQEIVRQLMRLWRETNVMVVTSSHRGYSGLDDKYVTCRIRLEAVESTEQKQHEHKATLVGSNQQVAFTIGTAGILS